MDFFHYFQSYESYFWQWEEEAKVIAIPDGSTIAYYETVVEVLEGFDKTQLPLFGSLLLAMVATNRSTSDDLLQIEEIIRSRTFQIGNKVPERDKILEDALTLLRNIQGLPDGYKSGIERIILLRTILEGCHNSISQKRTYPLVNRFSTGAFETKEITPKKANPAKGFLSEFRPLAILLKQYPDTDCILEKLNKIPKLGGLIDFDESDGSDKETGVALVDELCKNDKTFQVGTLVNRIWSGLNIPYHLSSQGEQAVGGVSGLTNIGEFDKLLISEFANDDLVFLSRLANNESLYLRREAPPKHNKNKRIILLDLSIKNWGIPKVLAHALLLAITSHPKNEFACIAFGVGDKVLPIKFESVNDVIHSLAQLEPCLHSAKGLEQFLDDSSSHKDAEVIFISSEESLQFPEMQRVLNDYHTLFKYWGNVDRLGNIRLYKNRYKSKHLIQEIYLPLEELWKKRKTQMVKNEINVSHKYPLLFPRSNNIIKDIKVSEGLSLVITKDKRIFRLVNENEKPKGMEFLKAFDFLNRSCKFEVGTLETEEHVLLIYVPQLKQIHFYNLSTGSSNKINIPNLKTGNFPEFFFHEGRFYYANDYHHWEISYSPKLEIKKEDSFPQALREAYQKRHVGIKGFSITADSILKNVSSIFINNVGNLVFNIHELRFSESKGTLKLENSGFIQPTVIAQRNQKIQKQFDFSEGSTITIDSSGLLVFKSSDSELSEFFIPSVLNCSLAACTRSEFSGNPYYLIPDKNHGSLEVSLKTFYHKQIQEFITVIRNNESKT